MPGRPLRPVTHVEIWNFPNLGNLAPKSSLNSEEAARNLYAKILVAVYAAIKSHWPDVQVVGFGTNGIDRCDVPFIEGVVAQGPRVARSFDILSTRPYTMPDPPEVDAVRTWGSYSVAGSLAAIRKSLAMHGSGSPPIWYTLAGWPIQPADAGRVDHGGKQAECVSPLLQAAYLVRLYAYALRLGVARVYIRATDTDGGSFGLFSGDGAWRPAAKAVQTMIKLMPCPRIAETISDGQDGYYAYELVADARGAAVSRSKARSRTVIMAWNLQGANRVEIPLRAHIATLVDMLGNEKRIPIKQGKAAVEVSPTPVYIKF